MIYVTHDQVAAMILANKIAVLKHGLVQQTGSPMVLYHRSDTLFVAGFLGSPSMNFLKVDVTAINGDVATVSKTALDPVNVTIRPPGIVAGGKSLFEPRPQDLNPDDPAGHLLGRVALTGRPGAEAVIGASLTDGTNVIVALTRDATFPTGAEISLGFDPAMVHLFAEQDGTGRTPRGNRWHGARPQRSTPIPRPRLRSAA